MKALLALFSLALLLGCNQKKPLEPKVKVFIWFYPSNNRMDGIFTGVSCNLRGDSMDIVRNDSHGRVAYMIKLSAQQLDSICMLESRIDFDSLVKSDGFCPRAVPCHIGFYHGPVYGFLDNQNKPHCYLPVRNAAHAEKASSNLRAYLVTMIGVQIVDPREAEKMGVPIYKHFYKHYHYPPPPPVAPGQFFVRPK